MRKIAIEYMRYKDVPPRQLTVKDGQVVTLDGHTPLIAGLEGEDVCVIRRDDLQKMRDKYSKLQEELAMYRSLTLAA